jgi:hypothetical protein
MYSAPGFGPVFTKIELFQRVFSDIKFYGTIISYSRIVTCVRTDGRPNRTVLMDSVANRMFLNVGCIPIGAKTIPH